MSEAERQQLFEERQQKSIDACIGKNEGESCKLDSPRGEMEGSCETMEESLVCMPNNPMEQRRE